MLNTSIFILFQNYSKFSDRIKKLAKYRLPCRIVEIRPIRNHHWMLPKMISVSISMLQNANCDPSKNLADVQSVMTNREYVNRSWPWTLICNHDPTISKFSCISTALVYWQGINETRQARISKRGKGIEIITWVTSVTRLGKSNLQLDCSHSNYFEFIRHPSLLPDFFAWHIFP